MRYRNRNLISTTQRQPSYTEASGIYDLSAQLVYKKANWPNDGIVATNLALWMDAGNTGSYSGSGSTWYDVSGNGNDATLSGTYSLDSTDGGGSMHFNTGGADVPIFLTDLNSNGGTIEGWVKILTTSGYRHITGWRHNESAYLLLLYSPDGQMEVGVTNAGQSFATDLGSAYWANNWNHIALTIDIGGNVVYYLNGQSVVTDTHNGTSFTNSTGQFQLNKTNSFSSTNQKHAVARVYTMPLTASDVLTNFEAERSRFGV